MVRNEHRTTPGDGMACRVPLRCVTTVLLTSNLNAPPGRRGGSMWWLFWAALAVFGFAATAYFSGRERQYVDETVRLRRQLESAAVELAEWQQAPAILTAPGTSETRYQGPRPDGITATIFVHPVRGIVLVASRLPTAPPGKVYEMWLVEAGREPAPAGSFQPQSDGSAIHVARNAAVSGGAATVMVTSEDVGGATRPSSAPILSVSIPAGAAH
jgi:anti-sigma-K factor RskA